MSNFNYLRGRTGFFLNIELVASCVSFPARVIPLESEFYKSRYSYKYKKRSDSNRWRVTVKVFVNVQFSLSYRHNGVLLKS